jgi:hypothetical protein
MQPPNVSQADPEIHRISALEYIPAPPPSKSRHKSRSEKTNFLLILSASIARPNLRVCLGGFASWRSISSFNSQNSAFSPPQRRAAIAFTEGGI